MAVRAIDHLGPRPRGALRAREWVKRVLIDVVATRTVLSGKRSQSLDGVDDVAELSEPS
jgi:hypothetical protein